MLIANILSYNAITYVSIILWSRGANGNVRKIAKTMQCERGGQQFTLHGSDSIALFINTTQLTRKKNHCLANVKHVSTDGRPIPIKWKVVEYKVQKKCPSNNCSCQPLVYVVNDKGMDFYQIGGQVFQYFECWFEGLLKSTEERITDAGDSGIGRDVFGITVIVQQLNNFNHLDALITFNIKDDITEREVKTSYRTTIAIVVAVVFAVTVIAVVIAYVKIRGRHGQGSRIEVGDSEIVSVVKPPRARFPLNPRAGQEPEYTRQVSPSDKPPRYPPQGPAAGYSPQDPAAGDSPQGQEAGFSRQDPSSGYPSQGQPSQYPPRCLPAGQPQGYSHQVQPAGKPLGYAPQDPQQDNR